MAHDPGEELRTLDLGQRVLIEAIAPGSVDPVEAKFVSVEITEVLNPKRIRVTFELHFRRPEVDDVLLGTFGLFPPDYPKTYLVATRGILKPEGALVLSMIVLDPVGPNDALQVRLRPLSLRLE